MFLSAIVMAAKSGPKSYLIKDAMIVGSNIFKGDLLIEGKYIKDISAVDKFGMSPLRSTELPKNCQIIDADGAYLLPGVIDDHVHFREPGATWKADIETESRAAALGGVTTFFDMPNNNPAITTLDLLKEKYAVAGKKSWVNYGFYLGATNTNLEDVKRSAEGLCCGVKVFMGSSTGNMLVDSEYSLSSIFSLSPKIIACHCEDEEIIRNNLSRSVENFGKACNIYMHPQIRSREACIKSTQKALDLAIKYNAKLHVLHISTQEEVEMIASARKKNPHISAEATVNHLWYCDEDYGKFGNLIKCNPAIKTSADREALRQAVREGIITVVGTDHAPHTWEEKQQSYLDAPSGIPSIQFSLLMMWELAMNGVFSYKTVVDAMCSNPALLYEIPHRGFLRPGYFADVVLVNPSLLKTANVDSYASKCKWFPLERHCFPASVTWAFVNGKPVVSEGELLKNNPHCAEAAL